MEFYIQTFGERYKKVVEENIDKINELVSQGMTESEIHNSFIGDLYVKSLSKKELKIIEKSIIESDKN